MALPTQINELWHTWKDAVGAASHPVNVNLIGPSGAHRDGIEQLFSHPSDRPATLRVLNSSNEVPPEADIHLVLLDPAFGPPTTQLAALRKINPKGLVLLMIGGDEAQFEARRREVATAVGVRADHVLAAKTVSAAGGMLARRLVDLYDEWVVPLARQFPFLREEAGHREVTSTSQQNAMVGALPVPGADMPIMTANQLKMVMRLAAIYDQPMTAERLKEVVAVVGGGFAMRGGARQIAKLLPGPGWLIAGGMGFAGTLAMGRGAIEYFKRGGDLTKFAPKPAPPEGAPIDVEATPVAKG